MDSRLVVAIMFIAILVICVPAPASASVWEREGLETPMEHKCMNAFLENARMNPDNATYLRDVWKNAGLNPQECREINGYPENYNEYD